MDIEPGTLPSHEQLLKLAEDEGTVWAALSAEVMRLRRREVDLFKANNAEVDKRREQEYEVARLNEIMRLVNAGPYKHCRVAVTLKNVDDEPLQLDVLVTAPGLNEREIAESVRDAALVFLSEYIPELKPKVAGVTYLKEGDPEFGQLEEKPQDV